MNEKVMYMRPCNEYIIEPAVFEVEGVTPEEMERVIEEAAHAATRLDTTQAVTDLNLLEATPPGAKEE